MRSNIFRSFVLAVLCMTLTAGISEAKGVQKMQALKAINNLLHSEIQPAKMSQVHAINKGKFLKWLKNSAFSDDAKAYYRKFLNPMLAADDFIAVLLSDVQMVSDSSKGDVVLLGVDDAIKAEFQNTDLVLITEPEEDAGGSPFDDIPEPLKTCRYKSCFCSSPNDCECTSTTIFLNNGEDCPGDECGTGNPCRGEGGDDGGDTLVMEVLGSF